MSTNQSNIYATRGWMVDKGRQGIRFKNIKQLIKIKKRSKSQTRDIMAHGPESICVAALETLHQIRDRESVRLNRKRNAVR